MNITPLEQFRLEVYDWFPHRADALMDLLDAQSSTTAARSVVELSLNPLCRREYSSVHDGSSSKPLKIFVHFLEQQQRTTRHLCQ